MPTSTAQRNRQAAAGTAGAQRPIDDTRITEITELVPPAHLLREFPVSDVAAATTYDSRQAIHRVLHGADDRLRRSPIPRHRRGLCHPMMCRTKL